MRLIRSSSTLRSLPLLGVGLGLGAPPVLVAQDARQPRCCELVELRQYTLRPGARPQLIELFDTHFVESQERYGIHVLGQFRDLDREDRFVWLRGFSEAQDRGKALSDFYSSEVWQEHGGAASATMVDVSNVLLLEPTGREPLFEPVSDHAAARADSDGAVFVLLQTLAGNGAPEAAVADEVRRAVSDQGGTLEAEFRTSDYTNDFPRLPVREADPHHVWIASFDRRSAMDRSLDQIRPLIRAEASDGVGGPAGVGGSGGVAASADPRGAPRPAFEVIRLAPTPRSKLGHTRGGLRARTHGPGIGDVAAIDRFIRQHHPDPFSVSGEATWAAERERLGRTISALPPAEAAVQLMRWVSSLGDGHTRIDPSGVTEFAAWYPFRLTSFADGLFVTATTKEHMDLARGRVVGLGSCSGADAQRAASSLVGSETAFGRRQVVHYLSSPAAVHAVGCAPDTDSLRLRLNVEGVERTVTVGTVTSSYSLAWSQWGEMFGPPTTASSDAYVDWRAAFDGSAALAYREYNAARPPHLRYRLPFYHAVLEDGRTVYAQINFMQSWAGVELNEFFDQALATTDGIPSPRLVLDLRYNGGGDGSQAIGLIQRLLARPDLNQGDRLFVLTGPKTFSAAVILVGLLDELTDATFVGEPAGAALSHFGDARSFELPSGMTLHVSTRHHRYDRWNPGESLSPVDHPAPMTGEAYFSGGDPALEAVLSGDAVSLETLATRSSPAQLRAVWETRQQSVADFDDWEDWKGLDGYWLTYEGVERRLAGQPNEAAEILAMVAEAYPLKADAWTRLAQTALAAGQPSAARAALNNALDLAPGDPAVELVRRSADSALADVDEGERIAEVFAVERAFARTLRDRDLEAFRSFLAEDALFFSPAPAVGAEAVVEAWRPYFAESTPPFAWEPTRVVLFGGGLLAHSSGPVVDADGVRTGTFNSVWRRMPNGEWRVILDKGEPQP